MNGNKKAYLQIALMMFISLATQLVALVRMSVVAKSFGTSVSMDAYNFCNNLSTFVFSFISTGISTVLIPAIVQKKPMKLLNTFITVLYMLSIAAVAILLIFREPISSLFSSGSAEFTAKASSLMFIALGSQFMHTVIGVAVAVFQCREKYNIPKMFTFVTSVLLLILVIIDDNLTIYRYALYVLVTTVLNGILHMICTYREKFIYKPALSLKEPGLSEMFKIFLPTVFSAGLYQISLLTDSLISSTLGQGNISVLTYSNNIMSLISTLLTANIMLYIYPKIAAELKKNNSKEHLFEYGMFFSGIMLLITAGFFCAGREGICVLYQRGEFTANISAQVYYCTVIYTLGLPVNVFRDVIYRFFYAEGLTKVTFVNSITASVFNIIISIILAQFIGIYGIALGTVLSGVLSLSAITIRFIKRFGRPQNLKWIAAELTKCLLSAGAAAIAVFAVKHTFAIQNSVLSLLISGVICIGMYVGCLFLTRSKILKIKLG